MQVETTYGNETHNLRKHLQKISQEFGGISKLGQRRFLQLHSACHPTITEIQSLNNILVANSQRYFMKSSSFNI
jgi:hypothetical protein